jgi:DNA-binding transcriptional ArsR family regulator
VDAFDVLSAPQRRRILGELARGASNVNQLVSALELNQPTISKHLKVLRESGFVSVRGNAQQRIYQLEAQRFSELDAWLEPYRRLWTQHLDALERHLDAQSAPKSPARDQPSERKEKRHDRKRQVRAQPARRRRRSARS